MSKYRSVFFGYRIYRIKFIKIVCFVFLISAIVFSGVLVFLMNTWMSDLRQQSQDVFAERERRLDNIRLRAFDYTNGMYEDAKLIEDTAALFDARSEEEYTELRRVNSLKSNTQIGYLPANIMKKLLDRQNQIVEPKRFGGNMAISGLNMNWKNLRHFWRSMVTEILWWLLVRFGILNIWNRRWAD